MHDRFPKPFLFPLKFIFQHQVFYTSEKFLNVSCGILCKKGHNESNTTLLQKNKLPSIRWSEKNPIWTLSKRSCRTEMQPMRFSLFMHFFFSIRRLFLVFVLWYFRERDCTTNRVMCPAFTRGNGFVRWMHMWIFQKYRIWKQWVRFENIFAAEKIVLIWKNFKNTKPPFISNRSFYW